MSLAIVLLFCSQLIPSQTTNASETQSTAGSYSSQQRKNLIESETTETAVKPYRSPTAVPTVSTTGDGDVDQSSSINPEKIFMVMEKKRIPTNGETTELATIVPDLLIKETLRGNSSLPYTFLQQEHPSFPILPPFRRCLFQFFCKTNCHPKLIIKMATLNHHTTV